MNDTSLDRIFSRTYQVLKIFLEDPDRELYLEQINEHSEIPKMTLFRTLNKLENEHFLTSRYDGYRRYWKVERNHTINAMKVLINVDSPIVKGIIDRYKDSILILYGSRARGTDTSESDWDLLLVDDGIDPIDLNSFVNAMEKEHSVTLDMKNYTREQFSNMKKEKTPFYLEVRSSMYVLSGDPGGL